MVDDEKSHPPLECLDQIQARLSEAPKKMSFSRYSDFKQWHLDFRYKIIELIGPKPSPVPLDMRILEEIEIDDYEDVGIKSFTQQKIMFNSEKYASVSAYLLIPNKCSNENKVPAILNAHGHGMGAKKLVNLDPQYWVSEIPSFEASAIHLVNAGYVVLVPDWRPFGERFLNKNYARDGRDPCNIAYMAFAYFGYNLLSLNVHDAQKSLDLLQSLPFIDEERIGMVGKSYGGTLTAYTSAIDPRIKVAGVSGYLSTLEDALSPRSNGNFCGSQFLPGLLNWGDIPDVFGLICPRPLLIESGEKDNCFIFEDTDNAFSHVKNIYSAGKASDKLERDIAPVEHEYIFKKMIPFLKKHL